MFAKAARFAISVGFLFPTTVSAATSAKYSYDPNATDGPDHWSSLHLDSNVTNQCGGSSNSPIAFNTSTCDSLADYTFTGGDCSVDTLEVHLYNNVVQMNYPNSSVCASSSVQLPGITGTLTIKQFHIHTSSEHLINGVFNAAELHLVHVHEDGATLGVVGIPIDPSSQTDNVLFAPILKAWVDEYLSVLAACNISSTEFTFGRRSRLTIPSWRKLQSSFNAYDLIPQGSTFYTYNGSLTTPPCSQSVLWNVVDTRLQVSVRQFDELTTVLLGYRDPATCEKASIASPSGSTSRPVQPLNGRRVVRVCPSGSLDSVSSQTKSAAGSVMAATNMMLGMVFGLAAFVFSVMQIV